MPLISIVPPLQSWVATLLIVEHTATRRADSAPIPSRRRASLSACAASVLVLASAGRAGAADCLLEPQGEGRVAAIVDARSLRLDDGREIRLAGIERGGADRASGRAALAAIAAGREVTLHGDDDTPDRYGRQSAFVFVAGSQHSVQNEMLRRGEALVSSEIAEKDCATALASAESAARDTKLGIWADPAVIKNTESPGDILAAIGHFAVVEGRVLSVRQAGAITYLNFGHNWTRDFAATISRRMMPAFEGVGLGPKSLENRRIRVRGVVSSRGGPRIELLRVGQIEVLGGK
jgi:endonuclease YncB( thermonuclease family)